MPVTVRRATAADGDTLLRLIKGLADYEKLTPPDEAAGDRIVKDLFDGRRFSAFLAEAGGAAVGYAIVYETYSTFRGLPKLYLEDVFVEPEARATGAGIALFRSVAADALARGCDALEWEVLDWNQLAIDFSERIGGKHETAWLPYRMERERLEELAGDV